MQIQRDRAYSPLLVVEDTEVNIEWDGTNLEDCVSTTAKKNPFIKDDDIVNPIIVSVNARNIGVGVAKNIHVAINAESILYDMVDLLNHVTQYNPPCYELFSDGGVLYFNNGKAVVGSNRINYTDKLYLLPNAEESFSIAIPPLLLNVVREYYIEGKHDLLSNYLIVLNVFYQDIQGKDYNSEIRLYFETLYAAFDPTGSGVATFRIRSK